AAVAVALITEQSFLHAEQILKEITDAYWHFHAVCFVSTALALNGHPDRAREMTRVAESELERISSDEERLRALGVFAVALAVTGQHERLDEILDRISDPWWQATTLNSIADHMTRVNERRRALMFFRKARKAARNIREDWRVSLMLSTTAGHMHESGWPSRARALLRRAEVIAQGVKHPFRRSDAYYQLATVLLNCGHKSRVEELVESVTSASHATALLREIALSYAEIGEYERAVKNARRMRKILLLSSVKGIANEWETARTFYKIAVYL